MAQTKLTQPEAESKIMQIFSNRVKILTFCLAVLPAFLLGILIINFSVNVPVYDQWGTPDILIKFSQGNLQFKDLIAQQNESRLLFPKLTFLALAYLTNWNVKYEMLVTFTLACLVSYNIYYLSKATLASSQIKLLILAFISNLLIFSSMQWENWLWGIQLVVFIPIACITTCLAAIYSHLSNPTKLVICACLCTISTFSYANGILTWIIVFPVLVCYKVSSWRDLNKKKWLIFAGIAGLTANAILYFYDYQKPGYHPSFSEAIVHPIKAISYFLAFLGSPLGFGDLIASQIVGAIIIVVSLFVVFHSFKLRQNSNLINSLLPWLMIGAYTIISALITTAGRVGFGVEQSLSSRYTTFSIYLIVGLIYLLAIILDYFHSRDGINSSKLVTYRRITVFLATALVILHFLSFAHGIRMMTKAHRDRLQGKACLIFMNVAKDEDCLTKRIFPSMEFLEAKVNPLNSLGFIKPSLVASKIIEDSTNDNEIKSNPDRGNFEEIRKNDDGQYTAYGTATQQTSKKPAEAVILAYTDSGGNSVAFAISKVKPNSSWKKSLSPEMIPLNSTTITAWAFDTTTGKLSKLDGTHPVQKP